MIDFVLGFVFVVLILSPAVAVTVHRTRTQEKSTSGKECANGGLHE